MRKIPLTRGMEALVDDEDYERLNQHEWYATKAYKAHTYYAARKPRYRKAIYMHNEILNREASRSITPDHLDGNGLNNQKSNLELIAHGKNVLRGYDRAWKKRYGK